MNKENTPLMIEKILRLKNFGIFYDFHWENKLEEFKKFNLIYSWNRSGKTTISRVFSSFEKKSTYDEEKFKQCPENGYFEIEATNTSIIKSSDIKNSFLPIKVFNQDFIEENISFDPLNSSNPIVYIGEEDVDDKTQLDLLRQEDIYLSNNLMAAQQSKNAKEGVRNEFLTGLGREISNLLFDKTYNKTKVDTKINNVGVDNFEDKIFADEDKKKLEETSKSDPKNKIACYTEILFNVNFNNEHITNSDELYLKIRETLEKQVISETIDRLKYDKNLNHWVKQGYDLHKTKEEHEKCLFCQNSLNDNFLESLSKHFSNDYEKLQKNIALLIDEINKIKLKNTSSKLTELYPDLKNRYHQQLIILDNIAKNINEWIDDIINKLEEKNKNPFLKIINNKNPDDFFKSYSAEIRILNAIIEEHNEKCDNHYQEVKLAKEKLELHTIATAIKKSNYKKIENKFYDSKNEEKKAQEAIDTHRKVINDLELKISSVSTAIKKINKHLEEFFGRKEIKLEQDDNKKGYLIKRNGKIANNLSESEKTAIAFSYFIVKIDENDFKINEGIIFIDDPISSFDTNFIYHCFCLIKNHLKEANQLFISTHNFQLFNLTKEWLKIKNEHCEKKNRQRADLDKKIKPCGFYMIENYIDSDIRKAKISMLDDTLKNFKSEYHFLFGLLNKFNNKEPNYSDFYTIGNIARRFFEIFLDFKIPNLTDQKQKLETLVKEINKNGEKISSINESKVYKLLNDFSHNSDPMSAVEHKDKSESQEAIKILLEII